MKKIAIRMGVILAIVVACSMFFANTILSITTPKVKFAEVGYRRFEEQISRGAELYFAKTNKITVDGARKTPVTVDQMYVRVGDRVAAGDTICTTKLSTGFAEEVDAASDALVAAQQAYMKNETDNIALVNTIDSDKNEAKRAMDDTSRALADAQAKLLGEAAKAGILLGDDPRTWAGTIQKNGDADLASLMEGVLDAQSAADRASTAFLDTFANSKTKTEVYEFLLRRAELQRELDRAQNKLVALVSVGEAMTTIRAEHEGYIVSLGIQEGTVYDGSAPAYELTAPGEEPALRVEITGVKREFAEGMRADIKAEHGDIRTEVSAVIREGVERKYLHIPLTEEMIAPLGGVRTLLGSGATVRLTYRAQEATTVLPPGAVRSEGDGKGDFIYVADYRYDVWGGYMVARKLPVTVLERGDKEVALQEDLRYGSRPVYQESKPLKEGGRIEEYID
ncbi:MAG: HlyD family secretion protein [Clostridia bacterium]|nr:HlyD family secretion protein [Clostridia bacterium]